MKADVQQVKIGSVMVVAERDAAPPAPCEIAFPLLVALVAIWWVYRGEFHMEPEMGEDNKDSTVMKRAREVRDQMDNLMGLLDEGNGVPDRGTLNQAREILEGMTRLVNAMEEGR